MKHLLLPSASPPRRCRRRRRQDRPTVQGTWRADYDNYWTRVNNERWISIQLRTTAATAGSASPSGTSRRWPTGGPTARSSSRCGATPAASTSPAASRTAAAAATSASRRTPIRLAAWAAWATARRRLAFAMHDVSRTSADARRRSARAFGARRRSPAGQGAGRGSTSTSSIKMRIHGVTPEFIKAMRDLGFKNETDRRLRQVPHPRRDAGVHQDVRAISATRTSTPTTWSRCGSTASRRSSSAS